MIKRWIKSLLRRQRIARYRRREIERDLQDERSADHVERAREGIKDIPPPSGGPGM
jgi:hypothetical protein